MIRNPTEEDWQNLRKIHAKFFAGEFSFEDFLLGSMFNFVITDENEEIITGSSVRPIAEIVTVTNLEKSPRIRRQALYDSLEIARFNLKRTPLNQIHAFVQNQTWEVQLIRAGFRRTSGNSLYINV